MASSNYVRMLDDFKMGPNLVRGFQPAGIGPRDITPGTTGDALGGTCTGAPASNCNIRSTSCPRIRGFRGAVFVDSGSVWDYKGETTWPSTGEVNGVITTSTGSPYFCGNCAMQFADTAAVRASVGASLIWDSPFGPLRFDFAYPILKQIVRPRSVVPVRRRNAVLIARVAGRALPTASLARDGTG